MCKTEEPDTAVEAISVPVAEASQFCWEDVSYGVGKGKKEKQILSGISGLLGGALCNTSLFRALDARGGLRGLTC